MEKGVGIVQPRSKGGRGEDFSRGSLEMGHVCTHACIYAQNVPIYIVALSIVEQAA